MYEIILKKSPNFDVSEEKYDSDVRDIANSLESICSTSDVRICESTIYFYSNFSATDIKNRMKIVFSYHIDNVRFLSLRKIVTENIAKGNANG